MRASVFIAVFLAACSAAGNDTLTDSTGCLLSPQTSTYSPAAHDMVMVFQRHCRGDLRLTSNVSLIPDTASPRGPGNILVVEDTTTYRRGHYPLVFATHWDSTTIKVSYPTTARVLSINSTVGHYRVHFTRDSSLERQR
jgi:hypothetical protein